MDILGEPLLPTESSSTLEASASYSGGDTCLMAKKEKKKKKKTKGEKIKKDEASSSLAKELELLKSEHVSLVCKYESLAK